MNKVDALLSLRPSAQWSLIGNTELIWHDTEQTKPTEAEIQAEITRLQAEYAAKQYQRDRAAAYPSIADQLDMIWHALNAGTLDQSSDFFLALKAVKDEYAKPSA